METNHLTKIIPTSWVIGTLIIIGLNQVVTDSFFIMLYHFIIV